MRRVSIYFIMIGCRSTSSGAAAASVSLTLLDKAAYPAARCMDGTVAGYYLAANASSQSWLIELEGGGECAKAAGCRSRLGMHLGSSNYFKKAIAFSYLLQDTIHNPRLRTWNRVFLPYCSQDLWTGQRTAATSETFGVYFSGRLILEAVIDRLTRTAGLADANEIVLTGESAGGIGVWPSLDWLAEQYPAARVVGAPIAGFYFYASPYTGPQHTTSGHLVDFREAAWPSHFELWNSTVDADCAAAIEPWRCLLANNSFPYVRSEAFIIESQTDQVVLEYHDWIPKQQDPNWSNDVLAYMKSWKNNMSIALAPAMDPSSPNGVFSPACFIHTYFTPTSPLLDGINYLDAFSAWYFEKTATKLHDDCGILCNPTCAHVRREQPVEEWLLS